MNVNSYKTHIVIVGAGFSGLMTVIHLLQNPSKDIFLSLVNPKNSFARGIAYQAISRHHLLNVPAGKMSCFPDVPNHFLDWLSQKEPYNALDRNLLATIFVPRNLYGDYLENTWAEILKNTSKEFLEIFDDEVVDIQELVGGQFQVCLKQGKTLQADKVVLAVGNEAPKNPPQLDANTLQSEMYFKNPWHKTSVAGVSHLQNILLIGNGLTMVDVVLALEEQGFKGKIYSISPNGFQILPHRHNGTPYTKLLAEIPENLDLNIIQWFCLFRKHIRFVRQFGISAEPVIDSIRSISPKIWQKLSLEDKKRFMRHLRHLWGVARHRLPVYVYDTMQEKQRKGSLQIISGKIRQAQVQDKQVKIVYWDKKEQKEFEISVDRVINCTGPNTDISISENILIQNLYTKKMIEPDELSLGIRADEKGRIISKNQTNENLFTLGASMRALLWESTAVPELREQAQNLANMIKNACLDLHHNTPSKKQ